MGGHLCVWNNCFTLINSARSRQVALQRPVCSDSRRIARRWVLICCWLLFPETMGEMRGWRWQRGEKGKAAGGGDGDDTGRGRLWTKPLWERVCARVSVAEKREGCKQHDGKLREAESRSVSGCHRVEFCMVKDFTRPGRASPGRPFCIF